MKKISIIAVMVLAVAFFAGCGKKQGEQASNQAGEKAKTEEAKKESGGVINSIKDAIGLGKKMECSYTYKAGNESFTTKTYVEGEKYKGETEVMGKKQMMVFDGETMYTWSDADKKGTKWTKSCMEDLNKDNEISETTESADTQPPTDDQIKDASEAFEDAMDVKCTPVASIDFSVPSDITFSDMCVQLKEMQDKFKDMNKNLPEGMNIPSGVETGF